MIGQTIGHYKILELLGKGGMGEVFLAEDSRLGRKVALKILSRDLASDADRRQRFELEARAAAALNHPNIVTIHSVEEADGRAFLTLELVDGRTLADMIPAGGLPLDKVLQIAIPLADAVGAAHQRGITHRDLKPANVMVTGDNRVKVLDFGLAKLREELSQQAQGSMPTQALTGEGAILGTVAYMAPEQAEGKTVDPRSDVFSLGVLLYEMATGQRPFRGDTNVSVLSAILKDTPVSISDVRKDMPRELARVVHRCLAKDPEDRYQTAKDLRNDLRLVKDDLASGELTMTSGVHRGMTAPSAAPKSHARTPLVVGAAAVVALGLGAAWYFGLLAPAAPQVAPFSSVSLSRLTTTGTAGVAAISDDGRYAAYVVTDDRPQSLWLRQITTASNVQIVPPADVRYDAVSFSPDGNYVYYVVYPAGQNIASMFQVPVLGGGPRKLVEDIDTAPTFSKDGSTFAFLRGYQDPDGTAVMLADASGNNVRELMRRTAPLNFRMDALAWSPDGTVLAAAGGNRDTLQREIVLIDAASGAETVLGDHLWRDLSYLSWVPGGSHLLVNGVEGGNESSSQIFSVSYPEGKVSRITNDLSTYAGLSVSKDGLAFLSVRVETRSKIWAIANGDMAAPQEVSVGAGTDDGVAGLAWLADGRLVYAASTSGNFDIWVMNADGSNRVQLTSDPADDYVPIATPDGRTIVFVSGREDGRTLWRMNADGSAQTRLGVGRVAYRPVVSFDGQWVYFSDSARQNFRIPIAGGAVEPLLGELTEGGRALPPLFHEPSPSPDGRSIAGHFQDANMQGERIAVLSLDSADERRFLTVPANAQWAPDGRSLLFRRAGNLYRQPIPDGPQVQLTKFTPEQIFSFAVSADQKQWALVRGQVVSDVVLVTQRQER